MGGDLISAAIFASIFDPYEDGGGCLIGIPGASSVSETMDD